MKKMVLRWVLLALFLTLGALLAARLGQWQLDRLEERRAGNAVVVANEERPPVPYTDAMGEPVEDSEMWRRVEVTGTYTGEQFQVRYRNLGRDAGIEVAAVMQTTEGDEVIIDRGFIPRVQGQPDTEVLPPVPSGEVTVVGYLHRDERGDDSAIVPHDFMVRLINAEAIGDFLGRDILPGYVILISSEPPNGEGLVPVTPPVLDEGNHFSYALQWFAFGIIAIIGIFVLIRADIKDFRKARSRKAQTGTGPADGDGPGGGGIGIPADGGPRTGPSGRGADPSAEDGSGRTSTAEPFGDHDPVTVPADAGAEPDAVRGN